MAHSNADTDEGLTTDHEAIVDEVYALEDGDTFAITVEGQSRRRTLHMTVTGGPYPDTRNYADSGFAEPYDIVVDVEERRNPSADFAESKAISYDPDEGTVYLKDGVGRFSDVVGIATETLAVDYSSGKMIAAKCECGQRTKMPTREEQLPLLGDSMVETADGAVTPCCRSSEWTTVLVDA